MWGCSEKTPSFALVCGCCLGVSFPEQSAYLLDDRMGQPQKLLRHKTIETGWAIIHGHSLLFGKRVP